MKVTLRISVDGGGLLRDALRVVHWVALCVAISFLGWPAFVMVESAYAQWDGERQLERALAAAEPEQLRSRVPTPPNTDNPPAKQKPLPSEATEAESEDGAEEVVVLEKAAIPGKGSAGKAGTVLGRFEIPRLGLSYIVLEGTDNRTLDRSIGHVEGTAGFGEDGNIGIAGHRNTHFRKLEWLQRGDELVLTSPTGKASYRVEWIRLFDPRDVEVLDPSHGPAVTLITCFPFEYVGSAPLRYIVRALRHETLKAEADVPEEGAR